jgi:hypothetical protein
LWSCPCLLKVHGPWALSFHGSTFVERERERTGEAVGFKIFASNSLGLFINRFHPLPLLHYALPAPPPPISSESSRQVNRSGSGQGRRQWQRAMASPAIHTTSALPLIRGAKASSPPTSSLTSLSSHISPERRSAESAVTA